VWDFRLEREPNGLLVNFAVYHGAVGIPNALRNTTIGSYSHPVHPFFRVGFHFFARPPVRGLLLGPTFSFRPVSAALGVPKPLPEESFITEQNLSEERIGLGKQLFAESKPLLLVFVG
jgi:hypothetical protein